MVTNVVDKNVDGDGDHDGDGNENEGRGEDDDGVHDEYGDAGRGLSGDGDHDEDNDDEDSPFQKSRHSSIQSQASEPIESAKIDKENESSPKPSLSNSLPLVSQTTTPWPTTPGSPPTLSASTTPRTTSRPISPRRHSVSFATTRGMFDDTDLLFQSQNLDLKPFLIRSWLSYEQFGAFLGNVKDLNAHKQTREETLRKAKMIFGSDNRDLFVIFEGLITRNAH